MGDVIITGVPRSGTSYLCALLHKIKNCVVVNEPFEMFKLLRESPLPTRVAELYQDLRGEIQAGRPIQNKMQGKKIIEDTSIVQKFEMYFPKVDRDDFLLCTKNTLGYLSRLQGFQVVMPHAPLFACIRHPTDTIASWKGTFRHLRMAAVRSFVVGSTEDPHLSDWQKEQVMQIAMEMRLPRRRAMLWSYLAELLWRNRSDITIIHYNDIVSRPQTVVSGILARSSCQLPFDALEPLRPSVNRTARRKDLSRKDYEAIEEICLPVAERFGYVDMNMKW